MIIKNIHVIWIGDEKKCPYNCIETWAKNNPSWEIKIWGNADLFGRGWYNSENMSKMFGRELCGVADMMRWEILYNEGGFAIDADSICLRPLDEWLFDAEIFACWENELMRPGLISNGHIYSKPKNPLIEKIILSIKRDSAVSELPAWQSVGPLRLTNCWREMGYGDITIYPSHYFLPNHNSGFRYKGGARVYAEQLWGSTRNSYDEIYRLDVHDKHVRRSL